MIEQISVFLENKSGRLVHVVKLLGEANINIRGLSIAETSDFGILRLIVDQPDKALAWLKENDILAKVTAVIAMAVPDHPGGLAAVLAHLEQAGLNIEYLYSFIDKPTEDAIIIMRVEQIDAAVTVLKNNNVPVIGAERIYNI